MPTLGWHFPHCILMDICSICEINPFAVVRPTGHIITTYIDVQFAGSTAPRINNVNVCFTTIPGVEGNKLSVWGPARGPGCPYSERTELSEVRAICFGHPHLIVAGTVGLEGNVTSIWR